MLGSLFRRKKPAQPASSQAAPAVLSPKKKQRSPKRASRANAPLVIAGKAIPTPDDQAAWIINEAQVRGLGGCWICSSTAKGILDDVCKARGVNPLGWRGPRNVASALRANCDGTQRTRSDGSQIAMYRIPEAAALTVVTLRVVA